MPGSVERCEHESWDEKILRTLSCRAVVSILSRLLSGLSGETLDKMAVDRTASPSEDEYILRPPHIHVL